MSNFNEELIKNVKLFAAENQLDYQHEEKYSFLQYIFTLLESKDIDDLNLCTEEFPAFGCNVDGYYYDVDSSCYNLFLSIYNNNIKRFS